MTAAPTSTRKRLGVLTPSSNTVLEPVAVGLTAGLPNLSFCADCERPPDPAAPGWVRLVIIRNNVFYL